MKTGFFLLACVASNAYAFTAPRPSASKPHASSVFVGEESKKMRIHEIETTTTTTAAASNTELNHEQHHFPKVLAATATAWTTSAELASAAGPDWGIFEGRTGSLLHPVVMGGLFLYSCYTAFLGFQWRRQRTIGDEITALKKTLPDLGGMSSVAEAVSAAQEAGDTARVTALQAARPTQEEITALQQERKDLAASGPRDRHFAQGALLAFVGTFFAIEGPLNTYARAGKLFPGPHLYVGASLVVIWSLAVGTIPAMQKGNDTARTIHIGANVAGLAFFAWQVQSGIPILLKVIEKTSWP